MKSSNEARSLAGQIAVVTGAAQGLGLGIAEQLATDGAEVFLTDVQLDKAEAASERLVAQGLRTHARLLDVTNSAAVDAFFESLVSEHGRVDLLVNNAGMGQEVQPTIEVSDEEWTRVIDINLTGTFRTSRAAGTRDGAAGVGRHRQPGLDQRPQSRGAGRVVQRGESGGVEFDQDASDGVGAVRRPRECGESGSGLHCVQQEGHGTAVGGRWVSARTTWSSASARRSPWGVGARRPISRRLCRFF